MLAGSCGLGNDLEDFFPLILDKVGRGGTRLGNRANFFTCLQDERDGTNVFADSVLELFVTHVNYPYCFVIVLFVYVLSGFFLSGVSLAHITAILRRRLFVVRVSLDTFEIHLQGVNCTAHSNPQPRHKRRVRCIVGSWNIVLENVDFISEQSLVDFDLADKDKIFIYRNLCLVCVNLTPGTEELPLFLLGERNPLGVL
jgi:hypothetical protein